ncbi:tRNA (uracil-5-)-methyltransferase homolog A [Polypterus senegalus]
MTDAADCDNIPVTIESEKTAPLGEAEKQDECCNPGSPKEENESNPNVYRYIKDDLFTSEIYKVEIQNLPKFIGFNDLKKFLGKHGVNPHKIKLFGKQTFAFVTFRNVEERDKAMKAVHGMMWKGRALNVRLAKPKVDPFLRKRKLEGGIEEGSPVSKKLVVSDGQQEGPPSRQIADVVTPLWNVAYEEQLKLKQQEVEGVLQKLTKEIGNNNKAMLPWLFSQKQKNNNLCCLLEDIRPSPVQTEYRNKCEFLIGVGANGEDKTVGFRLGKYKGGTCAVVEPSDTIHVPISTKRVVAAFQDYIRTTPFAVYSPETYEGHWRQLTVRITKMGQIMAIVYFHPQKLKDEELSALKASLAQYFTDGAGKECGVTSLYFVKEGQRRSPNLEDLPLDHVTGDKWIHEELLGLKFRISPNSFFQVNTLATEVLYSTVREWAHLGPESTVLDVCCGTGTIGICLAKAVKKVVGIELCQEAVHDARINAELNGLTNIEFHCGKAEDLFPTLINSILSPNVLAIVDPPRAGLHSKVILAIRRAEHLKRLIYVACNAKAAMNNFIDLCRSPSNRVKGSPFRPIKALPVDLFPHTLYCELLILFERVEYSGGERQSKNTEGTSNVSTSEGKEQEIEPAEPNAP